MVIFGLHLRGGLEINTFAAEKLDPVPGRAGDNTGWPDGPWQYAQGAQCSVIITPPVLMILIGIFTSAGEEGVEVFSDGLTNELQQRISGVHYLVKNCNVLQKCLQGHKNSMGNFQNHYPFI